MEINRSASKKTESLLFAIETAGDSFNLCICEFRATHAEFNQMQDRLSGKNKDFAPYSKFILHLDVL